MIFNKLLLVSATILSVVSASPPGVTGNTVAILNAAKFCIFLPPIYGSQISSYETNAVAFCRSPYKAASNDGYLPSGFIQSAHYLKNAQRQYVQVTGRIRRSRYGLSSRDEGGQYDYRVLTGAKCLGYNYFVELVEPDVQRYCLRCCKYRSDCPTYKSTLGCKDAIGGNYS
ncbi:hypothetical protein BGX26_010845 [Mortierella sp. AD094]|nr:hypothetical protein BGX26_010845 [Mortierella sp. AD094]